MQAMVSKPGERGRVVFKYPSKLLRNFSFRLGTTPIDPIPCTFECPRMGSKPEEGLPTIPRNRARLTIARTLLVPLR